jgi:6-phosphogluconolactonase (cycloisomerase 2 family)
MKNFLYVANGGSNNVSAFSIDPATGVLTAVPGSPFPTGASNANCISLATTPDDAFLIAANAESVNITVYSIAANGGLTAVAGSPFPAGAGGPLDGIKVTPDGKFLAVARENNGGTVSMYSISSAGGLTPVPGSPFPAGTQGTTGAAGVDCNCSSNNLFIGLANTFSEFVSVQSIAANGALSPIPGSPFRGPGINSQVAVLSPDDSKLFVSDPFSNSVTVFDVAADGALTLVPGSPFPTPGSYYGAAMATDREGQFLYVTGGGIYGFSIAPTGALTSVRGSPFPGGYASIAVFPPKSCCQAPVITDAFASPDVLWPPNNKLVDVTINYTETSNCPSTCTLSVTSNEPGPDEWIIVDAHHVQLRAERNRNGSGRIYTITITCTNSGGTATQAVTVLVPHDQGH